MAQLLLKNVHPSLVHKLEQRAKQLGSTIEAEAVRLLEAECNHLAAGADTVIDTDFDPSEQDAARASADSPPTPDPSSRLLDRAALAERQASLADAYPDEYVVLLEDRIIIHTKDKDEAYAHYDAMFDKGDRDEPIIVPPGRLRRTGPPVVRGRALSRAFGAGRP